jgi:hypothetical protein
VHPTFRVATFRGEKNDGLISAPLIVSFPVTVEGPVLFSLKRVTVNSQLLVTTRSELVAFREFGAA